MSDIYNSKLIDFLPENLKRDNDIIAASQALDTEFQKLANSIKNTLTYADIDNANSEVVDLLAWELNTDFYDNTLPLSKRRELAKNALIYHFTKGTPFAIEQLVTDVFDESSVQEWFEYGGQPYFFKITTSDSITSAEIYENLIKAVNSVKNTRSRLELINIERITPFKPYSAMAVSTNDIIKVSTNIPT